MLETKCDLVLVADGQRAVCFTPVKNGWEHLNTLWSLERRMALDHETGSDRPGRFQGAAGLPRSAFEESSKHDAAISRFLKEVVSRAEETLSHEHYERLAVVAPPAALGMLRSLMPAGVSCCVVQEIIGDYTRTPKAKLEEILFGARGSR